MLGPESDQDLLLLRRPLPVIRKQKLEHEERTRIKRVLCTLYRVRKRRRLLLDGVEH